MFEHRRSSGPAAGFSPPAAFALLSTALIPTSAIDTMGLALPGIRNHFAGQPHVGLLTQCVGSAAAFAFALSSPLMGKWIDRFGYRAVYIVSLILFTTIGISGAFAGSLWIIVLTRGLIGIAIAGALTAGLTGIGSLDAAHRPRMLGLHALTGSLGGILLFQLVGHLAEMGWRAPFAVHFLGLLLLPFALQLPRRMHAPHLPMERGERDPSLAGVTVPLLLAAAGVGIVMFTVPMLGPFHLIEIGVTQASVASLPLSAMALSAMLTAAVYSRIFARFGMMGCFVIGFILMAGGLLIAGLASTIIVFTLGTTLVGSSLCILCPNISAAAMAGSGGRPGQAIGITSAVLHGAPVILPFIAQPVMDRWGAGAIFVVLSAALLLGSGAYWVLLMFKDALARSTL